jgi:hypothetical protein
MYGDKRPLMWLSQDCWKCLKIIQDMGYANSFVFLLSKYMKQVQETIRNRLPDIQDDWLRIVYEGKTLTFSLSDDAILHYKPRIQEFSCFGSAVKILGAYENYLRRIVEVSDKDIPKDMSRFRSEHKSIRSVKDFWADKLGRGIDFLHEVFGWNPRPSYRPSLRLMFELRNIAVHNAGIVNQKLCNLANDQYIEVVRKLRVGDNASWNLSMVLQLEHLIISVVSEADRHITPKIRLPIIEQRAFWDENCETTTKLSITGKRKRGLDNGH